MPQREPFPPRHSHGPVEPPKLCPQDARPKIGEPIITPAFAMRGGFILALEAGVPIVPVSIRGGHGVLPKGSLRIRPGTMEVTFGRPIDTTPYSSETKDALIEMVRRQMEAGLRTPGSFQVTPGTIQR